MADVNARGNDGTTPLLSAAEKGHLQVVRCLVEKKAHVEARDKLGQTALIKAAFSSRGVVRYLVEQGNADLEAKNKYGHTAFTTAIASIPINGSDEVAMYLIKAGADVNVKIQGMTSLERVRENSDEYPESLLEHLGERSRMRTFDASATVLTRMKCIKILIRDVLPLKSTHADVIEALGLPADDDKGKDSGANAHGNDGSDPRL
eukprot:CAMPEP_0170172302 /NCGR_PEP_ID=MMETSP0040_2-20121228/5533_1 /TAXON_ID=641309 /ORGANISM="Lotharella oceanica, Strain CCMP622" /LENGTH=204 /DNA_ID=CAMNT_0010412887 /DNA_START=99 /DNA_END=713 /DNA_ORIENTATION=+